MLRFLRTICTHNGQGISVNQEKVHEQLFNNPDTYSKTIITTTTMEDRKRLFVFFKSADGIGEQSVPLDACFIDGTPVAFYKELEYFKEMLELFAAMCCSRNYVCTETIRNWFPITAVQNNMWNPQLSLSLRAVFCKLMLSLYLDAYPRERLKRPEMCRIFQKQDESVSRKREVDQRLCLSSDIGHEIRKTALNISAAVVRGGQSKGTFGGSFGALVSSVIDSHKKQEAEDEVEFDSENSTLLELKEAIFDYFSGMADDPQFTEFSNNLLKVAHDMALFGLFGIEYTDFVARKCILSPMHKGYQRANMDLARLLKALKPILTKKASDLIGNDTLTSATTLSFSIRNKNKRKGFTYKSLNAQVMKDPFSLADPIVRGAVNLRNYVESVLQKPGKDEGEGSHELEMKIEVCKVFDYAVDCRLDYLLSNVVEWFVQNQDAEFSDKAVKEIFPPVLPTKFTDSSESFWTIHSQSSFRKMLTLEVPDLDELLAADGRILADLVSLFTRSKRYKLQTLVVSLIIRLYSQRREMLAKLSELHVVTHPDDIEIYKWTKQNLVTLKQFTEQSEIWLKFWKQTDQLVKEREETKLRKVTSILERLDEMLTLEEVDLQHHRADRQDMLYFLDVHKLLISLIRDGMHTLADVVDMASSREVVYARERILYLFALCHRVLRRMVERNARNQRSMHSYLHIFTSHLSIDVEQISLICEIFHNNWELCANVKQEILQQFARLIVQHGRQTRFLSFFEVVQVVRGQPIPDNQRAVLNLFLSVDELRKYLLYQTSDSEHEFSFVPAPPHDQALAPYEDQPFLYHSKLFRVLMRCGFGTNRVYLNEAKCQKAIPLETVFLLLEKAEDESLPDEGTWRTLLIPLLDFFFHIYLETEKLNEELAGNVRFVRYIRAQEERLYSYARLPSDYNEYFSILVRIANYYANSYLKLTNEALVAEQQDFLALKDFAVAFSRNLRKFHGFVVTQDVLSAAQQLLKFFDLQGDLESLLQLAPDKYAVECQTSDAEAQCMSPSKLKWESFRKTILSSQKARKLCKKEMRSLIRALIQCKRLDSSLEFSHLLQALVEYLRSSVTLHAPVPTVLKLIKMLNYLLKSDSSHLKDRQEELNNYGATRVILSLMSEKELDQKIYSALLRFSVNYLNGGNEVIQKEFFLFFVNTPTSRVFIERLHLILAQNAEMLASETLLHDLTNIDQVRVTLRLLQLCCENHNSDLQNYIRQQANSRTSFDLVSDTVKLLSALMKRMLFRTFHVMSQCFDTLTEAIQGPCVDNQNVIIDGLFLEMATTLMSYDESAKIPTKYASLATEGTGFPDNPREYLAGWMIAHLKYKCLITIHSLMEGRTDSFIITRIIRAINVKILRENLVAFYLGYEREYGAGMYEWKMFGKTELNRKYDFQSSSNPQDKQPEHYTVILENAFFIYHLMRKYQDTDDPENNQIINEELPQLSLKNFQNDSMALRMIGDLSKIGLGLVKKSVQSLSKVSKLIHSEKSVAMPVLTEKEKRAKLDLAYEFLQNNTGSIEIIFNGSISRIYFPLPPYAHCLTDDIIEDFHTKVDRSSDKNKLQGLVTKSAEIIEVMKHEYRLQLIINTSWIMGMIARNVSLWKDISFLLTLILNFIILTSFSIFDTDRLSEYSLFYYASRDSGAGLSITGTRGLVLSLGLCQICVTSIIVVFFLVKTGPLLIKRGWKKVAVASGAGKCVKVSARQALLYTQKVVWILTEILSDIDVLFYVLYLLFAVFGTFVSPMFFAFHLLDILYRYPSLQNVVKAITLPKKSLLVTFLFALILVYYFAIIAYAYFYDEFSTGDCDDLLTCTVITFDHGFKVNGGIGGALSPWPYGEVSIRRLLFDNLYNIIIIVIMMNIFQGIIIDTFALLREENQRNSDDRENKCFICGLEKDLVERATNRRFRYHTFFEHNEWKYVQFMGYLEDKDETELTGMESFVKERLSKNDISWFPQQEGLSIKKQDKDAEEALQAESAEIGNSLKEVVYQTQELKRIFGVGGI